MTMALMNTRELAEWLGVPTRTVDTWRTRGSGPPYVKVGRYVRYDTRTVDKWLATRVVEPNV